MNVICTVIGHARHPRRLRRAGNAFVSVCKRCRTPMARPSPEAEWRTYDPAVERFEGDRPVDPGLIGLWSLPRV